MPAMKIISPGGFTTIQDRGRFGYQNMGIPVSGVLDVYAFTLANLLVGNRDNTAVMELTILGPSFEIQQEMDIALTGAQMGIRINDRPMAQWRSHRVKPGDHVAIGQVQSGCRAYLAVSGGFLVPEVMGSFSTYAGGQIGGFKGRPLEKTDVSEPAVPGSIQIPADEQPIILLKEQTVGGYAKIATVISSDLPWVAQTTPGDTICFECIDLKTAHQLFAEEKNKFDAIKRLWE
jgi:allophanate hydrolase subunit 2